MIQQMAMCMLLSSRAVSYQSFRPKCLLAITKTYDRLRPQQKRRGSFSWFASQALRFLGIDFANQAEGSAIVSVEFDLFNYNVRSVRTAYEVVDRMEKGNSFLLEGAQ
jgi:hypothetical protein